MPRSELSATHQAAVGRTRRRRRCWLTVQDFEPCGGAPRSRPPGTRCTRGPAPRARARDGEQGGQTTTVGNGVGLAGARRRPVAGSAGGRGLPRQHPDRPFAPTPSYGPRTTRDVSRPPKTQNPGRMTRRSEAYPGTSVPLYTRPWHCLNRRLPSSCRCERPCPILGSARTTQPLRTTR